MSFQSHVELILGLRYVSLVSFQPRVKLILGLPCVGSVGPRCIEIYLKKY